MLCGYAQHRAAELNGYLIPTGKRLIDLSAVELCDYSYSLLVKDRDSEGRRKIELMLVGKIGERGGEIVDDPLLPASMQGMEAPAWWTGDHDPFADQHTLSKDTQIG